MTAFQVYQVRKMLRQGMTYGAVCDRTGSTLRQIHALQYGLVKLKASKAARYWNRNLDKIPTAKDINAHFAAKSERCNTAK